MTSNPRKLNGRDDDGRPFVYRHRHVNSVLLVVETHVKGGDARVRIAAIRVERRDALQVGVEPGAIKVLAATPWQAGTLACGEHLSESGLVDGLHTDEGQPVHDDCVVALRVSSHAGREKQREGDQPRPCRAPWARHRVHVTLSRPTGLPAPPAVPVFPAFRVPSTAA